MISVKDLILLKKEKKSSRSSYSYKSLEKIMPKNNKSFIIQKPKILYNAEERNFKLSNSINHRKSDSQKLILMKKDEKSSEFIINNKLNLFDGKSNYSKNFFVENKKNRKKTSIKLNNLKPIDFNDKFINFKNQIFNNNSRNEGEKSEFLTKSIFYLSLLFLK